MTKHFVINHARQSGRRSACDQCGSRQWHVGRITAECACCGNAVAIGAHGEADCTPFTPSTKEK